MLSLVRSSAATGEMSHVVPHMGAARRLGALPEPALAGVLASHPRISAGARGLLSTVARGGELPALTSALIIAWVNRDRPAHRRHAILELACAELGHALTPGLIEALLANTASLPQSTRAALAAVELEPAQAARRLAAARGLTRGERVEILAAAAAGHYLNILAGGLLELESARRAEDGHDPDGDGDDE